MKWLQSVYLNIPITMFVYCGGLSLIIARIIEVDFAAKRKVLFIMIYAMALKWTALWFVNVTKDFLFSSFIKTQVIFLN